MKRTILLIAIALLALTACSLSSEDEFATDDTESTPIAALTQAPANDEGAVQDISVNDDSDEQPTDDENSQSEDETVTDDSDSANSGTGGATNNTNTTADTTCTPRTDWPNTHVVAPGQTLGSIARDAGTTVSTLADANCIDDINVIRVGQAIRVPRVLTPPTLTPAPQQQPTATFRPPLSQQPPQAVGGLDITQSISGDGGFLTLLRDAPATVTWRDAPAVSSMTVYAFEPGWTYAWSGPNTVVVGEDNNPADGLSVAWTGGVTPNLQHELIAFGYDSAGSLVYVSHKTFVASAAPAAIACRIRPLDGQTISYYTDATTDSAIVGEFSYPQGIPVMGRMLNGWYAISDHVAFSGVGGVNALKWVPGDAEIEVIPGTSGAVNTCG